MDNTAIQKYLKQNLGVSPEISSVEFPELPNFIRRQFEFLSTILFEKNISFLVSKKENFRDHKLQELESTSQLIRTQTETLPVFVFHGLSKRERLILINHRISFIVPYTQMFLPLLGLDLYDRIPESVLPMTSALRPAAQSMLLEQLLNRSLQDLSVNKASQIMGYTAMGTLRAANQLKELNLIEIQLIGHSKILKFSGDHKKLWMDAAAFLRNPVKKTISIEDDSLLNLPFAGEYALSLHSDLSVSRKCYALHHTKVKELLECGKLQIVDTPGSGVADIQIWNYTLPSWTSEVDLLSLELSFKNNTDPRIKIALLELEEQRKW